MMKKLCLTLIVSLLAINAHAASTAKPVAKTEAPAAPANPVEQTSAMFFSTCAASMGNEKDFTKKMQTLVDAKTAVKMDPSKLTGMVNADEAKNAWAVKGFADANKPILLTWNSTQKVCGMHVSDTDPNETRHAFQADLKKLVDLTKAKIKVYKPETKGDLTAYSIDLLINDKIMQLGIAISKDGKEFLTAHMQD